MMNSFGFLGASLVVLHIIGYVDWVGMGIGGILVVLDLFLMRMYYKDVHSIQSILLGLIQHLEFEEYNELENEEE